LSFTATAAYAYYDEGLRRSTRFWSFVLPAYLHYEFYDYFYKDPVQRSIAFNRLHDKYSPMAESIVLDLRGYFLKFAQMMSVRDDFTPLQYLSWCRRIQDQAPVTFSSSEARAIAERESGATFDEWEDVPIGSASIGQVYKAKLDGETVAVKVQGPHVERQFRIDMKQLRRFCELAMPQFVAPLKEIEAQFMTEFDYSAEAQNLERVRSNLTKGNWGSRVVVPRAYIAYCTKNVLVMEYLKGRKILDLLEDYLAREAKRQGKPAETVQAEFMEKMRTSEKYDNDWDEYLLRKSWVLTTTFLNTLKWLTFGLLGPPDTSLASIDTLDVINTVMKVHGYQVLVDGEFNGDPHPGNLLLLEDGRIGLIDFGQVKRLSEDSRRKIAQLFIAINDRDVDRTFALTKEIGIKTKYSDKMTQYRTATFWLDRDTPDVTGGLSIHRFLELMEKQDPAIELSRDIVMVGRCSLMIRSLACALGLKVGTSDYWREYAELNR
jgi:aarF domain-containing kinase